ncbi:hypothetical protein J6590_014821 [Homalodisca vitripennis]|nr:hypothetical protein J6590_014821 [Homalodisca vitripennis]
MINRYDSFNYVPGSVGRSRPSRETNGSLPFRCDKCGWTYMYKGTLSRHQRFECGKSAQFCCPHCPYRAKQKTNLVVHLKLRHKELLDQSCDTPRRAAGLHEGRLRLVPGAAAACREIHVFHVRAGVQVPRHSRETSTHGVREECAVLLSLLSLHEQTQGEPHCPRVQETPPTMR